MIFAMLCSFISCKDDKPACVGSAEAFHEATKDGGDVEVVNESVTKYIGVERDIEITNDFTISTEDEFFDAMVGNYKLNKYISGRMLENSTINGNGHTITIKGSPNGSLGRYSTGLFGRLINCEVNDLNIVYDFDVNLNSSSRSVGGFCGVADNCVFRNCTLTYNKGASFSGYRAGGIAGLFSGVMEDCSVKGDFKLEIQFFGGLAGGLGSGTVKNCNAKISLDAGNLHDAEIGGLFGWMQGDVSATTVTLSNFSVWGLTDKWTNYDAYCGVLAGKVYGHLHDCLVELETDASVCAREFSSGYFHTNMHTGIVTGYAAKDSKINNIFIDAKGDDAPNVIFPDNSKSISLGIAKNETSYEGEIYYAEDALVHQCVERISDYTEQTLPDGNDIEYSFNLYDTPCTVTVSRSSKGNGEYRVNFITAMIGDAEIH